MKVELRRVPFVAYSVVIRLEIAAQNGKRGCVLVLKLTHLARAVERKLLRDIGDKHHVLKRFSKETLLYTYISLFIHKR
jgi:hypothetical protein